MTRSNICPRCGVDMSDNIIVTIDRLIANCLNCGWRGEKHRKTSTPTTTEAEA